MGSVPVKGGVPVNSSNISTPRDLGGGRIQVSNHCTRRNTSGNLIQYVSFYFSVLIASFFSPRLNISSLSAHQFNTLHYCSLNSTNLFIQSTPGQSGPPSPVVCGDVVALVEDDLRSHVLWGPTESPRLPAHLGGRLGEAGARGRQDTEYCCIMGRCYIIVYKET